MRGGGVLNFELIRGEGGVSRYIVFAHGIYGAGRNWNGVARRVIEQREGWGAAMVDLREHGGSTGHQRPHTIEAAAGDLIEMLGELDAPAGAVAGHSFGGKVALMLVRLLGGGAIATGSGAGGGVDEGGGALAGGHVAGDGGEPFQVWIIDSTPSARPEPSGSAWDMLGTLRATPGPFTTRAEAVAALEEKGVPTPTAQWVSTNLERLDDGTYGWRIDLDVMEELLHSFFETDLWDVVEDPPAGVELHFIKATESSVLDDEAVRRIDAARRATGGRVHLHEVAGGHWLNADNPDGVVAVFAEGRRG